MCAWDPANTVASHPWPNVNVGTRKGPLSGAPTISVSSKHQRVNLCYCASDPDGVLKDTRFILVRAECPYDQFMAAAHVISIKKFIVKVTNGRERERSQVSNGKVKWVLRAWLLLSLALVLCSDWFEVRWIRDGSIGSGLNRSPSWGSLLSLL